MKTITVKMVQKFSPCYNPTIVEGINEKSKMTLIDAMDLKIKDKDKVWLASKFMTEKQCRIFAIWCARRCKTDIPETKKYINAIEGFYIKGTHTQEEMEQAEKGSAAYSAAGSAACWAAYGAAHNAAHNSAHNSAERKVQVKKLKSMIKKEVDNEKIF